MVFDRLVQPPLVTTKSEFKLNAHVAVGVTCLWLHREVRLPLQDGVDELGIVSKHGIISICGCHLGHCGPCGG